MDAFQCEKCGALQVGKPQLETMEEFRGEVGFGVEKYKITIGCPSQNHCDLCDKCISKLLRRVSDHYRSSITRRAPIDREVS